MERIPKQQYGLSEFPNSYDMPESQALQEGQFRQTMEAFPNSDFDVNYNLQSLSDPTSIMKMLSLGESSQEIDDGGAEYDENGELPLEVLTMVDGLYALTGAKTVRQDAISEDGRHEVLRRGTYGGQEVFFMERTHMRRDDNGNYKKSKLFLQLLSPDEAERGIKFSRQIKLERAARLAQEDQERAASRDWDMIVTQLKAEDIERPSHLEKRRGIAHSIKKLINKRRIN